MTAQEIISKSIIDWAATRPDEIVFEPKEGFYSFDIVVDAYKKGKGELDVFKEEVRRRFFENAKTAADISVFVIDGLKNIAIPPQQLFINNSVEGFNILITLPEEVFDDPDKLEKANNIIFGIQSESLKKEINVQIAILPESINLNKELIKADGYGFMLDVSESKPS
jgi:hypothetical protein